MKKLAKIALSVILALAIIIVPMSVMAATGDSVPMPSWQYCIYSGDTVTVGVGVTQYFEIGTNATAGTYDFEVTGTGAFDVNVCTDANALTEGGYEYVEGTAVSAVDGKVTTTITSFELTSGYACFAITNNSDASAEYTCNIAFPEGTQDMPKQLYFMMPGASNQITVPAQTQYYVSASLPMWNTEFKLTITGNTGFGYTTGFGMPSWDNAGTYSTTVSASMMTGGNATFAVINNTATEQTYTLTVDNLPLGAQSNPDELPLDTETELVLDGNEYWYQYMPTEAGVFTLTVHGDRCADGWTYNVQNTYTNDVYNFSTGWGENDKNVCQFEVDSYENILVGLSVPTYYEAIDSYDVYTPASGTVYFTATFKAGATLGGEDGGEDESDVTFTPDENNNNMTISSQYLAVGTDTYSVDTSVAYTAFVLEPSEAGIYTITSSDSLMGIVSYNGMWATVIPSADTVSSNSLEWDCTDAGQSIWVAVWSPADTATITVEYEEAVPVDEVPWTVYENKAELNDFTFEGDIDALEYVDISDDDVAEAVLGDDGYYHLNDENGPVIYVDLDDDEYLNLIEAAGYGQLKNIVTENDVPVAKYDYNEAFLAYVAVADENGLYPLTADLIEIYQNVGAYQGWYGEDAWVDSAADDAWMFSCMYELVSDEGSKDDNTDEGTGTGTGTNTNTNTGSTTGTGSTTTDNSGDKVVDKNNTSPVTGDSAIALAVAVTAAAALVIKTKKVTE